jgi:uncharacterized tellurite resistance protein B-like protein
VLAAIQSFFDRHLAPGGNPANERHSIELATAALLVEVSRAGDGITPEERTAVERAVRGKFGLTSEEATALFELAEAESRQANDYFQFTSLINRQFTAEQRERVIELMWAAAYADGELSAHEQHVMRKVAGLLYVGESAYIAAKMRAKAASGTHG